MSKIACLTGVTGQCGSYLSELLLDQGYEVYGMVRRSSIINHTRLDQIYKHSEEHSHTKFKLIYGDLADSNSISNLIGDLKPDLFINAAAMSHVKVSFEIPEYTADITGTGVLRCLEAIRKFSPRTRFLQCSSSEMFGNMPPPQNELTTLKSCSPYASAKIFGYHTTINYREAYNLFASNAIAFNMESPRRGHTFVTKKITTAAARISLGLQDKLFLGNLEAKRDWQHAKDACRAMLMILDHDKPDDFAISSGESHSIQEFVELVFSKLNLDWKKYVEIDERLFRPTEVPHLCGDSTKLRSTFDWKPNYSFHQLIDEMIKYDLKLAEQEFYLNEMEKSRP